jgi:hypothetical protein
LLGFVSSVAKGKVEPLQVVLTTVLSLGFIVVVARWGNRAVEKVAETFSNQLQVGEAEFAIAMVLLFGLAALSEKIGVAAIIGAFSKPAWPSRNPCLHGFTSSPKGSPSCWFRSSLPKSGCIFNYRYSVTQPSSSWR